MEASNTQCLEHLVVDAGPIIKGERLEKLATNFWTVPEVIAEIRDSKSRQRLLTLPYEIKTLEPDAASMKAVSDFAKLTGDLQAISFNDLKVLALTYMLEAQSNGISHIRTEPPSKKPQLSKGQKKKAKARAKKERLLVEQKQQEQEQKQVQKQNQSSMTTTTTSDTKLDRNTTIPPVAPSTTSIALKPSPKPNFFIAKHIAPSTTSTASFTSSASSTSSTTSSTPSTASSKASTTSSWASIASSKPPVKATHNVIPTYKIETMEVLPANVNAPSLLSAEEYFGVSGGQLPSGNNIPKNSNAAKKQKATSRILAGGVSTTGNMDTGSHLAEEDDGEGWVNETNLQQASTTGSAWGKGGKHMIESIETIASAGCITTDFAMQNVMLQMGLKLLAVDGRVIKRLKQWVLKCDACYHITPKMTGSTFCERCGSDAMKRLSVRVGSNGKVEYGYNPNRRISTRGQVFSIATRKGGRDGQGLILRPDQTMMGTWNIKSKEKNKVKSQFGEDITGSLGLDLKTVGGNLTAGFGRRNPNAQKGRERRGKRGTKHQKNKRFNPYRTSST